MKDQAGKNQIIGEEISFSYDYEDDLFQALKGVSFVIEKGEFIAVLGPNGCGKSTLVKHLNGILSLQEGRLKVLHIDASREEDIWELRRLCGMVFQNPDSQFVSSIIEEDIAFGLRNYDTPEREIPVKVQKALSLVGMEGFERCSPHTLSGGQKQRIALAGVLAVEPDVLIFDEATSMLDPMGRREMMEYLEKLHRIGKTIVMVTHNVEEAGRADRIILMKDGEILRTGVPQEILTDEELLKEVKIKPPVSVQIYYYLQKKGIRLLHCPLTGEQLAEEIGGFWQESR